MASSDAEDPVPTVGWLAGFSFIGEDRDNLLAEAPSDLLRKYPVTVRLLVNGEYSDSRHDVAQRDGTARLMNLSEQSIVSIKGVADELLPVFAKHFTDVHIVLTPDRLEISAPFRTPAELSSRETAQRNRRVLQASEAVHRAAPVPPMVVEEPTHSPSQESAGVAARRRRWVFAIAGVAAIVVFGALFRESPRSREGTVQANVEIPSEVRSIPVWSAGLGQKSLNDWIDIQKRLGLPDATMRSVIRLLRENDKFAPGHSLHDLTAYPTELKRVFALLASQPTGAVFEFGPLERELKGRTISGARFPDEKPGGHYSWLQREALNNIVVLATVELLHRHQSNSDVKEFLAALQNHSSR